MKAAWCPSSGTRSSNPCGRPTPWSRTWPMTPRRSLFVSCSGLSWPQQLLLLQRLLPGQCPPLCALCVLCVYPPPDEPPPAKFRALVANKDALALAWRVKG